MTRYSVTMARPLDARSQLLRLWRDNLPRSSADAKFAWTYLEAPVRPEQVFLLSAQRSGARRTVGTAGLLARDFDVAGARVRAGLLADLAVDRAHRFALPAMRLVREVRGHAREQLAFAYGFPSPRAVAVFRRCGYRDLGTMVRYARVLRHRGYAQRVVGSRLAAAALGPAADAAVRVGRAPATASALRRYRLTWTGTADGAIDALWERVRGEYRVILCRNAAFVRWRWLAHHQDRVTLAVVRGRRSGEVRGYAAVEFLGQVAHIRDFLAHPHELAGILERVVLSCRRRGAASVTTDFFGDPRVARSLGAVGFSAREAGHAVVFDAAGEAAATLADPAAWFLTDADEDR